LDLARQTEALFKQEETVLSIEGPTKIFGDIHGMLNFPSENFSIFVEFLM
jgi:hypothetical protein